MYAFTFVPDERRIAKELLLSERMIDDREVLVADVCSSPYQQYESAKDAEAKTDCADDDGLAFKAEGLNAGWISLKVFTQCFGGGVSCANMGGSAAVLFEPVSLLSLTSVSDHLRAQ